MVPVIIFVPLEFILFSDKVGLYHTLTTAKTSFFDYKMTSWVPLEFWGTQTVQKLDADFISIVQGD